MNPSLQLPEDGMTLNQLADFVANQMKRLNMVLKNIDGLNIVDIKFELQGGAFIQMNRKGLVFNDGTQNTFTVDIDGNVTVQGTIYASDGVIGGWTIESDKLSGSGIIQGGIIRTAGDTTYPRVELDSLGNIFQAFLDATSSIAIDPDLTGSPTYIFETPNCRAYLYPDDFSGQFSVLVTLGDMAVNAQSGKIQISAQDDIELFPTGLVKITSWSKLYNGSQTLQTALNAKQNTISGDSGSFDTVDGKTVTVSNGIITSIS